MYRGQAKHDESTERIRDALHGKQPRYPVTAHAGVASVGVDGVKPRAHDCGADCSNADANERFNQSTKRPNERPNVVMIGGR